ncbi:hypothetical protein BsWGS_22748 [Bradybaena similaris]
MAALLSGSVSSFANHNHNVSTDYYPSGNLTDSSLLNSAARHHTHSGGDTTNPRLVTGIVVLALMLINVLGNSLVLFVYQFRIKPSVFSFYVKVLALLDISTGLTTMPLDAIIKLRPLDERSLDLNSLCKIGHFQVYAQSLISGCVFTLIAYQRYRKICHPLKPALTLRIAKRSMLIISAVCIPLSIPTLVLNGSEDIQIRIHKFPVNITICRNDKKYEGSKYQIAFPILLLSAFCLVLCLTVILYVMVAKAMRKFERSNSMVAKRASSPTEVEIINREQGFAANRAAGRRKHSNGRRPSIFGDASDRISTQMYRVFSTITIIFIVSYLPHLVVLILRKSMNLDALDLSFAVRIVIDLAYNCPYLSTVANPIVYGYCNTEFRDNLKNIFFCCRRK